jgi:hypothetical protein
MAFTESNRVDIRRLLGFSANFVQADPRLENAITSVQAISDGGTRPDNSTELAVKSFVTSLQTLETKLASFWDTATVGSVDEIKIDAARGSFFLRSEGRRLVTNLSVLLGLRGPRRDIFSASDNVNELEWIFNVRQQY